MNASNINTYVQKVPVLNDLVGEDKLRMPVKAELKELFNQLQRDRYINEPDCVQCISAWHDSLWNVLHDRNSNRYPKLQEIIRLYVEELILILRGPDGAQATFPVELFGDKALPIVQFMVAKMRNPNSVFYSEPFDQEAIRILAGVKIEDDDENIPPEILAQLNQFEAERVKFLEKEMQSMEKLQALKGRLEQRKVSMQDNIAKVAADASNRGKQLKENVKQSKENDLKQRAIYQEKAAKLRQEIVELNADTNRLQKQLEIAKMEANELEQGIKQLQVNINQLRAAANDTKANWLAQVVCISASITISWILKKPVLITPNGISTM